MDVSIGLSDGAVLPVSGDDGGFADGSIVPDDTVADDTVADDTVADDAVVGASGCTGDTVVDVCIVVYWAVDSDVSTVCIVGVVAGTNVGCMDGSTTVADCTGDSDVGVAVWFSMLSLLL